MSALRPICKKLGWRGWASMLRLLQHRPMSTADVAEEMGVGIISVRHSLNAMHDLKLIHIAKYEQQNGRGAAAAFWAWGNCADAEAPMFRPSAKRDKTARYARRIELFSFAAIIRLLDEPVAMSTIMEQVGCTSCNLSKLMVHCRQIGLVRVADWEVRTESNGNPAMLLQIGWRPDAPKPKTLTRAEITRRCRASRTAKQQMLGLMRAVAGVSEVAV